jgi:hypothetical protein
MGTGYAGPGWEWPKGRDFDCTVGCFVTAGNKAIETITGGNLASRMRHNQHHVQRQQLCPPLWGAHQSRTLRVRILYITKRRVETPWCYHPAI